MNNFGLKSLKRIKECHIDLQTIAYELIKVMDVTILCGHRNEIDQNNAFINGKSKLQWPQSKHNVLPSLAIDIAPYPIDWKNIDKFNEMCDHVERIAKDKGIKIRLGRDFSFKDYPHVEII